MFGILLFVCPKFGEMMIRVHDCRSMLTPSLHIIAHLPMNSKRGKNISLKVLHNFSFLGIIINENVSLLLG